MGPVPAKGDGPSIPKDEVPAKRPREEEPKNLWRLTVPRWTEIIHKCDKCHRLNMLNKQRVVTDANGMTIITTLLQDCCRDANLRMSDVYFQNFKWAKKEEGTG
ncbi:hypothetical protein AAVH_28676 [Aphelenchoides avenae]|nr:hypothetical protein AAVH_28676 [Aphelenchus avenae]